MKQIDIRLCEIRDHSMGRDFSPPGVIGYNGLKARYAEYLRCSHTTTTKDMRAYFELCAERVRKAILKKYEAKK